MPITIERVRRRLGALAAAALTACATVQPDARMADVRELAGERLSQNMTWARSTQQEQLIRARCSACCSKS
jgi:hypothetical protein